MPTFFKECYVIFYNYHVFSVLLNYYIDSLVEDFAMFCLIFTFCFLTQKIDIMYLRKSVHLELFMNFYVAILFFAWLEIYLSRGYSRCFLGDQFHSLFALVSESSISMSLTTAHITIHFISP